MLDIEKYIYLLVTGFFVIYSLNTLRSWREKKIPDKKKDLRSYAKEIENYGFAFEYDHVIALLPIILAVSMYLLFTDLDLPSKSEVMIMAYMSGVFFLLGFRNSFTLFSSSWAVFLGISTLPLYIYINQDYYVLLLLVIVLSIVAYLSCYALISLRDYKRRNNKRGR